MECNIKIVVECNISRTPAIDTKYHHFTKRKNNIELKIPTGVVWTLVVIVACEIGDERSIESIHDVKPKIDESMLIVISNRIKQKRDR